MTNTAKTQTESFTQFEAETPEQFLAKLEELVNQGIKPEDIQTYTPFHIHEVEHILKARTSPLRFITLAGALAGFFLSFLFILFTVFDWPIMIGGKPLVSIPAFIIVAFECTILIGGIVSFLGFLHLNRLPNIRRVIDPVDCGNSFIIRYYGGAQ